MKILLVDDDEEVLKDFVTLLVGHEVETADNLKKGLKQVKEGNFDLLITDWKLGGYDTAAGIVEIALETGLKTLIQSSNPDHFEINPFRDRVRVFDKITFMDTIGYVEEVQRGLRER
ncbi:MAG TPA: response regulator [Patescibacteria group bacterium]|nr:response regulator [Patescibacteria group bacterium]